MSDPQLVHLRHADESEVNLIMQHQMRNLGWNPLTCRQEHLARIRDRRSFVASLPDDAPNIAGHVHATRIETPGDDLPCLDLLSAPTVKGRSRLMGIGFMLHEINVVLAELDRRLESVNGDWISVLPSKMIAAADGLASRGILLDTVGEFRTRRPLAHAAVSAYYERVHHQPLSDRHVIAKGDPAFLPLYAKRFAAAVDTGYFNKRRGAKYLAEGFQPTDDGEIRKYWWQVLASIVFDRSLARPHRSGAA